MKKQKREYNARREIAHRIDRLDRRTNGKLIEKSRSFVSMNIAEDKLNLRIKSMKEKKQKADQEIKDAEDQIALIKAKREELGYEHDIIVTEHAMLRFVERYMGIDMDEVYRNIVKLPKSDVTKFGNTIVTVYPVDDDSGSIHPE